MNFQQYVAANPLPPGTTRWGQPANPTDGIQLCTFDIASQLAAMLNAAWSTAGLVPTPGMATPAIVDGGGTGNQCVNSDILATPPVAPFTPIQEGFFGYYGFLANAAQITIDGVTYAPGQYICLVDESFGELQARGLVNPQGIPAGELGGEIDKNILVGPTGTRYAIYTSLALEIQDGNVAVAYWVAP